MASILAERHFSIELIPPIVSKPYLEMTRNVMEQFSVQSKLWFDGPGPGFEMTRHKITSRANMRSNQMRRQQVTFGPPQRFVVDGQPSWACLKNQCKETSDL